MAKPFWLGAGMLAAALVAPAVPAQAGTLKSGGVVSLINSTKIKIQAPGGLLDLKVAANTKVKIGAKVGKLADVKVGAKALVTFDDGNLKVSEINLGVNLTAGKIVSVDEAAKLIGIDTNLDGFIDLTCPLNTLSQLSLCGLPLQLSELDLLLGQKVNLVTDLLTGLVQTCDGGDGKKPRECSGTIIDINKVTRLIRIRCADGSILDLILPLAAKVNIGGKLAAIGDLVLGDNIRCLSLPGAVVGAVVGLDLSCLVQTATLNGQLLDIVGNVCRIKTTTGQIVTCVLDSACQIRLNGTVTTLAKVVNGLLGKLVKVQADVIIRGNVVTCTSLRLSLSLL